MAPPCVTVAPDAWPPDFAYAHTPGWQDADGPQSTANAHPQRHGAHSPPSTRWNAPGCFIDPRALSAPLTTGPDAPRTRASSPSTAMHATGRLIDSRPMAPPWIAHADATPCVVPTAPSVDMLNELCELLSQGGASRNTDPDETPPFHILDILGGTSPQAVVRLPILSDPHALGSGLPSNGPAPPSTADAGATDHDALDLTIALLSAQLGENSTFSLPSIAGTGETGLIALGLLPTLPAAKYGDKPVLASPPSTVGTGATVHLTEVPLDSPPVARRTGTSIGACSLKPTGGFYASIDGRSAREASGFARPTSRPGPGAAQTYGFAGFGLRG
ncbi:hypothetical protein AURDEDRAFT_177465 [Auricularia subglabra TFB-10046 SS5]|uniref:Uncharacterized protein n=1 Tax=Auricularia subglabra (strain TFB-10046 / SS5) TaxID=717982 RepID=J0WMA5_AURST|nr:hypothetical protein AURDEDRAFT_177465 [Auricularia subglabra TFB-10046 SS5]